jgi:hypothetical protein
LVLSEKFPGSRGKGVEVLSDGLLRELIAQFMDEAWGHPREIEWEGKVLLRLHLEDHLEALQSDYGFEKNWHRCESENEGPDSIDILAY